MTPTLSTTGPESIVVSLENAKKLKEAGWPQDTLFDWREYIDKSSGKSTWEVNDMISCDLRSFRTGARYAAPTADEILRRLPEYVKGSRHSADLIDVSFWKILPQHHIQEGRKVRGYIVYYEGIHEEWGDTLANAAAAMWWYLAEQKLLLPAA